MRLMVVGAGRGLGRAFIEGLGVAGDKMVGVSRRRPNDLHLPVGVGVDWIETEMAAPLEAVGQIERQSPLDLDVLIYNLGVWEEAAFTDEYDFLADQDQAIVDMVNINITGTILLLKRLIPRLLSAPKPQLILTGSTSGLRQSGRPEVTFAASKFALTGIADALREGFRGSGLALTVLQLGYLDTEHGLTVPRDEAIAGGSADRVPVHDVVAVVKTLLGLSGAAYVRELVLPAIRDERF